MQNWTETASTLLKNGISPVCFFGPPGTGKSYLPQVIFGAQKTFRVQCTPGMDRADFIGTQGLRNGTSQHVPGPAIRAFREAACLVLEEIDRAPEDIQSLLQAIMDSPEQACILDSEGNAIRPEPGFIVVCTTNSLNPLESLPGPISDRVKVFLPCTTPATEALAKLTKASRKLCESYYAAKAGEWSFTASISFRRLLTLQELVASGLEITDAAKLVFGKSADEVLSAWANANGEQL